MIDHSLAIPPTAALVFHLKQGFWLYGWPMIIGFVTILGYQALGRVVMMGAAKWPVVFALASVVSMISLFGWVTMVRFIGMIPLYGLTSVYVVMIKSIRSIPIHPKLKMPIIQVI